ncbi:hypothetical protein R1sor_019591 [Riccia sorocarpa]|uniref:Uncharacterized protein n=1 Tax=Riccia sorocarpa TaxID=122646 RepID=A0ABD3IJ70_9MARC
MSIGASTVRNDHPTAYASIEKRRRNKATFKDSTSGVIAIDSDAAKARDSHQHRSLGWMKFKDMADALNVCQVGRIVEGDDAEWIQLARSFILRSFRRGSHQRECRQWTVQEGLILLALTRVDGSSTLTRILGSWYRARKRLQWDEGIGELGDNLSLLQVEAIFQLSERTGVHRWRLGLALGLLRRAGIHMMGAAMEISRGVGWRCYMLDKGIIPEEEISQRLETFEIWCQKHKVVRKEIWGLEGWRWKEIEG